MSGPNVEPAYTIVGTHGEGGEQYVVTVYTYNGPEAALTLAHEAYAEQVSSHSGELDPPELQIVAIFAGEPQLVDLDRRETWPGEPPILDHTYAGNATRIVGGEPGDAEQISGAFRVLCWLSTTSAVIGNGEQPESVWVTFSAPERAA